MLGLLGARLCRLLCRRLRERLCRLLPLSRRRYRRQCAFFGFDEDSIQFSGGKREFHRAVGVLD